MTGEEKVQKASIFAKGTNARDLLEDKSYYTVLVFQCEDQLKAFFKATGWMPEGEEYWIDGLKLAEKMGIKLPKVDPKDLARVYQPRKNQQFQDAIKRGLKTFHPKKKGGE